MVYTEIKEKNGRKYYYRVISVRDGNKVNKKRIYLGANLAKNDLAYKEIEADKKILSNKLKKTLKEIIPQIIRVLRKYNVKKAGIFGSYARGQEKKDSDLDIIIQTPKRMGIEFVKLNYDLEDVSKKKVDLITYNGANPRIKKYILDDEIRII